MNIIMWLKIVGSSLSAVGALVLALRVKNILDSLVLAQSANEINTQVILDALNRRKQIAPVLLGTNDQVEKEQKKGTKLLVFGFLLIAIGNSLVGISIYLES